MTPSGAGAEREAVPAPSDYFLHSYFILSPGGPGDGCSPFPQDGPFRSVSKSRLMAINIKSIPCAADDEWLLLRKLMGARPEMRDSHA